MLALPIVFFQIIFSDFIHTELYTSLCELFILRFDLLFLLIFLFFFFAKKISEFLLLKIQRLFQLFFKLSVLRIVQDVVIV